MPCIAPRHSVGTATPTIPAPTITRICPRAPLMFTTPTGRTIPIILQKILGSWKNTTLFTTIGLPTRPTGRLTGTACISSIRNMQPREAMRSTTWNAATTTKWCLPSTRLSITPSMSTASMPWAFSSTLPKACTTKRWTTCSALCATPTSTSSPHATTAKAALWRRTT